MPVADAQQLRALIGAVVQPGDSRRTVAVRADAVWAGPDRIDGATSARVVPCASPLAVRAALVDHADLDGGVLVILTPCADRELGLDVLARLAKGRVLPMDPFSAVLALFGARVLDPTLVRDERWMIDDLIALAPPGGWPERPAAGGVLDIDTAWQVWHSTRFGSDIPDDIEAVIRAGADPTVATRLVELDVERRTRLATRWAGGTEQAGLMIELITAGHGIDLAALGLVADVLWATTDDAALAEQQRLGRARMEPLLGRDRLDARSASAWAEASRRLTGEETVVVDRAEQLLAGADTAALAVLSDDLVAGFDLRVIELAKAVAGGDVDAAELALEVLSRHRLAASRRPRLVQAEAAVRVARRADQAQTGSTATAFPALADEYAHEGAWVDEARLLLADGDPLTEVASVYATLCARLDEERRTGDLAFAHALADWSKSEPVGDDRIIPLEHVLDRVVARVGADTPVLVVVGDGVSLPVTHQLLGSLAAEGWTRAMPADIESWPVGVAMLPTVTEVSRASLLAGTRTDGGQKDEIEGFAGHAGLRQVSPASRPPVLYHKGKLVGPSGHVLADDVQASVADPEQRIVGVVLNPVDDHLARGQQVKVTWDVATMGPLGALLEAARDAGRVVVLTADHGHVIHGEGATSRPSGGDGGERWRNPTSPVKEDEVDLAGPRVLKGGRVILPADDRIRYGGHKHGYHGGACPQEVLVPVEVLARTLPDGWVHKALPKPSWWSERREPNRPAQPVAAAPRARAATVAPAAQPTLFEPEPQPEPVSVIPGESSDWVEALFAAPLFAAHRSRLPRPMSDQRVGGYLRAIHANGGIIPLASLAARTGEPPDQVRMALTMVQRLVNLDGAEVLALRDDQSVHLNGEVLQVQFGVEVP